MKPQKLETRALAQLLERRERVVSFLDLAWKYRFRWTVLTGICVLVWLIGQAEYPMAAGCVAGIGVGAMLSDVHHLRMAARLLPMQQKFIDWNRVEELLRERSGERDGG
ncbi:MAG: hypothetical protein EHM42_13250 [Planctomycetaceae bacterium]|nr:MAG: hypothetical protein EHM42_13250 [Planctomycetaceae bacterium]